jgi:hypothetical protein
MDKIDYWFLDTAISELIGFSWIVPDEKYGGLAINRSPLPLSMDEINKTLYNLFQNEMLLAIRPDDMINAMEAKTTRSECYKVFLNKGFAPCHQEIDLALKQEAGKSLSYFLTEKGGELWEYYSYPQWDKYRFWAGNRKRYTLRCSSYQLALKLLKNQHLLDFGCVYIFPVMDTVKWKFCTPWQPTYWKTLPYGYEIRYQVKIVNTNTEENESEEIIEKRQQAEKWNEEIENWYSNYFDWHSDYFGEQLI